MDASPVYQRQLLVRHDLENLGNRFGRIADGLKKNPNASIDVDTMMFLLGEVEPTVRRARIEGLDSEKLDAILAQINGAKMQEREGLYRAASREFENLSTQIPLKDNRK